LRVEVDRLKRVNYVNQAWEKLLSNLFHKLLRRIPIFVGTFPNKSTASTKDFFDGKARHILI